LSATLRRRPKKFGEERNGGHWIALVSVNGTEPRADLNLRALRSSSQSRSTDHIQFAGVKLVDSLDWAERDFQNRELEKKVEEFVLDREKRRLEDAGRDDLARDVRWVSKDDGDGLGYNIGSFEEDGQERYIEVKTTNQEIATLFYVTQNELEFSRHKGEQFYLYRVYDFSAKPQISALRGALDGHLALENQVSRATITAEPSGMKSTPGSGPVRESFLYPP
jgi:Domain of unknown function (DUF3883)